MDKRELVLETLNKVEDISNIMREYDSIQHVYGGCILYQTEAHMIEQIGDNPGTSASQLSEIFAKTVSACSQIIKKLLQKKLIVQKYAPGNCKVRRLYLTEAGEMVYKDHHNLEKDIFDRDIEDFDDISAEDIKTSLRVIEKIYNCFQLDLNIQKEKLEQYDNSAASD